MEDTFLYVVVDQALIMTTSFALGEGEREVPESLVNLCTYEEGGRALRLVPGLARLQGRRVFLSKYPERKQSQTSVKLSGGDCFLVYSWSWT